MIEKNPEKARHELRLAYNSIIDAGTTHFWDRRLPPGVHPDEALTLYKRAFQLNRQGHFLASERLARAAQHLAIAMWHEAKITYLEPRVGDLPYLEHATAEELDIQQHTDTTTDLLASLQGHIPQGEPGVPHDMSRYLMRARRHLEKLVGQTFSKPLSRHELLEAEHLKAAYQYARALECLSLAYEAEKETSRPQAA